MFYRGLVMKMNERRVIIKKAHSIVDLLSASGGMIAVVFICLMKFATAFSRLSFELGVISLMFLARSTNIRSDYGNGVLPSISEANNKSVQYTDV